jgi:hypothetical protein
MTTVELIAALAIMGIALATVIYIIYIIIADYLQERRTMKQNLTERRNAMVGDLAARILFDHISLDDEALEARKELIRASFGAGDRWSNGKNSATNNITDLFKKK